MTCWLPANSFMICSIGFRSLYLLGRLLLNIFSMRSVMKNPPTTLLVAATMAITPSTVANSLLRSPTRTIAPTTAIASRALVSDIRGVCSKGETWRMTSKPMKQASMKMRRSSIRLEFICDPSSRQDLATSEARTAIHLDLRTCRCQSRQFVKLPHSRIHDFTAARYHRLADNFILQIELQLAVFHHVGDKRRHIAGIHLAGVVGYAACQVNGADNRDAILVDHFADSREFANTTAFG